MSAPPKVFISATSADLRSVRKLVTDAVLTMGCHPVAQDHFAPEYRTVATMLEDKIKSCQALIHIVGHHYGAEPDVAKLPEGVKRRSYTQMEFDTAKRLGIKTYVFVCPEGFPYDEVSPPEGEDLRELQESHRQKILTGDWVYTPVEDRDAVASSVQQLQLELNELRGKVERGKRGILLGIAALLMILVLIGAGVSWVVKQSGSQTASLSDIQKKLDSDRKLMLAVLAREKEAKSENATLTAAQSLELAVKSVAAEQSLSPEEVQASLDLFAATVESGDEVSAYDQGLVAMAAQDFTKAADLARKAISEAEGSGNGNELVAEASALLGDALLADKKYEEAAAAFRKAAELVDQTDSPERWQDLVSWTGSAYEKAGMPEAAAAFRRSVQTSPGMQTGTVVMSSTGDYGIKGPPSSLVGASIALELIGTVPPNADLLAIVKEGKPTTSTEYANSASVAGKAGPVNLSVPAEAGSYQIRLLSGGSILAIFPIELTQMAISVVAPESVKAGAFFEVVWTGPNDKSDMITVVAKGAKAGTYKGYAYTKNGNPASIRAQDKPDEYEVRYLSGKTRKTLAVAPIQVEPVTATLKAVPEIMGGATLSVEWTGPANKGDFITVVTVGAKEGAYGKYAYTEKAGGQPVEVRVPEEPGDYEIRYVTGNEKNKLTSTPIKITEIVATVSAATEAVAGSEIEVTWTGPGHQGDYITIVSKDADDKVYKNYVYTKNVEATTKVLSIETPGEAEVRYLTAERKVAARQTIRLLAASAQLLDPPAEVTAGDRIQLKWEGPNNPKDLVVIALPDAKPSAYKTSVYCNRGQTNNEIRIPKEAGTYEVRYLTGQDKSVLARAKIVVK